MSDIGIMISSIIIHTIAAIFALLLIFESIKKLNKYAIGVSFLALCYLICSVLQFYIIQFDVLSAFTIAMTGVIVYSNLRFLERLAVIDRSISVRKLRLMGFLFAFLFLICGIWSFLVMGSTEDTVFVLANSLPKVWIIAAFAQTISVLYFIYQFDSQIGIIEGIRRRILASLCLDVLALVLNAIDIVLRNNSQTNDFQIVTVQISHVIVAIHLLLVISCLTMLARISVAVPSNARTADKSYRAPNKTLSTIPEVNSRMEKSSFIQSTNSKQVMSNHNRSQIASAPSKDRIDAPSKERMGKAVEIELGRGGNRNETTEQVQSEKIQSEQVQSEILDPDL